jgi:hypothetical protein
MNTFTTSLILILIGFAMFYPIFFTTIDRFIQNNKGERHFLQLNYVLHLLAGSIAVLLLWIYGVNYPLQLSGIVYLIFYRSFNEMVEITPLWPGIFTGILSAGAISIVSLLLVSLLKKKANDKATYSFINSLFKYLYIFIGIRIAWDLVVLFNISVETRNGELMSALRFFLQVDSLKLILLILFGFIIPIIFYFLFSKRLGEIEQKHRFWIFLILFMLIWFAEFLYKYFLLQYGIVL